MRFLVLAISLLLSATFSVRSEVLSVPIGKWQVTFDAPAGVKPADAAMEDGYYYTGTGGKTNVSLYVSTPWCRGQMSMSANYDCFRPRLDALPGVVKNSISFEKRPENIQVTYVQYARVGDSAVKIMHTNVLFQHDGKWGDLHVSVVKPTVDEIAMLLAVGDQFKVEE